MNLLARFLARHLARFLGRYLRPSLVSLPEDMTAAVEVYAGGRREDGFALTGYPQYLGAETDADGIRYVRVRIGSGPDAHVVIRTDSGKWCAAVAEAGMSAHDALHPVPPEMGEAA